MMTAPQIHSCMVVGLGQIGMGYDLHLSEADYIYTHARAFSCHKNFELVCGVDPSSERCDAFSKRFKRRSYRSVEEALANHSINVVAIATPTHNHLSTLQKVLGAPGLRAILCEKPLAESINQAKALVELCKEANVGLYVNYMRRSTPGVIEIKRMIDTGEIASPARGIIWYSKGFIHNGSHFFNLAEYWLGEFKKAQIIDNGRILKGAGAEPEVKVSFVRGDIIFVPAWEEAFSHYTVELISPSGRLYWGHEGLVWQEVIDDPIINSYKKLTQDVKSIPTGMCRYQWHVVNQLSLALAGKDALICTGNEALQTLSAMHRIIEMRNQ